MAHLYQQPLPPDPLLPAVSSRPSKRVPVPFILSSFPAPPSHIPICNPPPTGPPTDPLPPLPSGPSRISEHEQLLILSSVRSRRSSYYSQKDRDSIVSSRSPSSLGRSVSRSDSLTVTTPQHTRMSVPLSDISDSDTEAVKTTTSPVVPQNSPRRLLPSHQPNDSISSINTRDVLLGVYADDTHNTHRPLSTARHISQNSADSVHPDMLLSTLDLDSIPNRAIYSPPLSPSGRSNYPLHSPESPHRSLSGSYRPTHARSSSTVTAVPGPQSQTQSPIQGHKHSLSDLAGIVKTTTTTTSPSITTEGQSQQGRGGDHMTLDELSSNKQVSQDPNASTIQPPHSSRVPSPDIATILSVMPRPALSLSRSRSGADADAKARSSSLRSKSRVPPGQRRVVSTNANTKYPEYHPPNLNRTQSEGALTINKTEDARTTSSELAYLHKGTDSNASKPPSTTNSKKKSLSRSTSSTTPRSSVSGCYDQEVEDSGYYDEVLERVLEREGSEDEGVVVGTVWDDAVKDNRRGRRSRGNVIQEEGNGEEEREGDSDSSLDLHTPLPHLMLRHGLLSPNSKLLPQADCSRAATPLEERPGSIMSVVSNGTKSGLIKDERDTVTRRVRHRDGKLLRGGIGLTTGLGWSDSEDEDAPSPLTRRLSSLNLSRRSSASSIHSSTPLSSSSSFRRIHPLSRSYSSGAILETEGEHDEPRSFDEYSSFDDEEEDRTIEETGHWAQRYRISQTSPPAPRQRRGHPPPSTEKALPPLPTGGLKKKLSGNLQKSIISNVKSSTTTTTTSTTTSTTAGNTSSGTGKYSFPSSRIRTFSCTSGASTTPSPTSPIPASPTLSPSSSAVTIKPNVRPLQLPRQSTTSMRVVGGDRPAVPVPSPTLRSLPQPLSSTITMNNSLRAPTTSLSTSQRHRPSPITPILLGHTGTTSAPASPAVNGGGVAATATGMIRPKPRTGTGMVYRTSSYGVGGSKMRAPMILSGFSTNVLVSSGGVGGGGNGGGPNSFSGAIAL